MNIQEGLMNLWNSTGIVNFVLPADEFYFRAGMQVEKDEFYGDLYVVRYQGNVHSEEVEEDNIFDAVNNVTSILREEAVDGTVEV